MKVVVSKTDLISIITKIQSIVPAKPSSPVLSTVLLEAIDDQLIISATDLSVSMRCLIAATIVEEGSIALPARRFFQLVREITTAQIKINSQTSESAEITTGSSVFKIHGMNKAEFPHFPEAKGPVSFTISHRLLKEALSKSVFAAAREDNRYTLNGVQLQISKQKAIFIGTDGKRLAKVVTPIEIDPSLQGNYVISLKSVEEIIKMLDDSDAQIQISLSQDKISVENGSTLLIAKLLAGQYPDVERVIPSKLSHQFSVHREELMLLLRQISLFTSDTSHSARFSFENGQLHLSASSAEIGEGKVSMPVDYAGERMDIAFNPHFFIDILRHSKDETIKLGLIDSHNPGLITDSTNALFVIMPMRISEIAEKKEEASVS